MCFLWAWIEFNCTLLLYLSYQKMQRGNFRHTMSITVNKEFVCLLVIEGLNVSNYKSHPRRRHHRMFNFSWHTLSLMITICKIIQPDVNLESNDKIMLFTRLKFHVEKNNSRRKWNQWISNWPLPELPVWFKSNSISVLFFLRFFYQTSFFSFWKVL